MEETFGELVERHVEPDSNWYIDTYSSYIEVCMSENNKDGFEAFIEELKGRGIEYEIESVGREGDHVVHVYA